MRTMIRLITLYLWIISTSCAHEENNPDLGCCGNNSVQNDNLARELIVGKWVWKWTSSSGRGFETTIETPESTNSERIYEFSDDKLKIYIDGDMTTEMGYEVQFWGVETGSNNPPLAVRYEDGGLSMLVINSKGECMGLINSFNDAGGGIPVLRKLILVANKQY